MDRRDFFLKSVAGTAGLTFLSSIDKVYAAELENQVTRVNGLSPEAAASDEDFWGWVRESFTVSPNIINLNNGGVSPQPKVVQDAHIRYYQYCNEAPSYYMWRILDAGREGFVLGEGGVALILEELDHALARGAKIYAEIIGGGMSADAHHITAPHPEGLGATLVMQRALKDAGIGPEVVDYINTHGTSTPLGDLAELKAITNIFGEQAYKMNISSTKSMTGHLLGAAGAIEAMATVLAVQNDIVPPTINNVNPDPELDPKLNLTFNKAQKRTINYAISNTFGFGGHNAAVVVKKYTA